MACSADKSMNNWIAATFRVFCVFAGMVSALDDAVGALFATLKQQGMLDNSIIVFTTDNGGPANNYDGNCACNLPLR